MADFRKIEEIKRAYFQGQLGVSFDSLYDLEKKYYNEVLGISGDIIVQMERFFLQVVLVTAIDEMNTLWNMYWDSLGVPAGTYQEREREFYLNYGYEPDGALITEDGDYLIMEDGGHLLYR